ncbi:hypothetical protein AAFF_G00088270 [Aldrovandia affinis]|uniref:Glycosyltransferase family 92 protein n=1 Tax=Aldrovandia affinis TaxID=143900 RepID=A0AAD7RWF3_9TELE|nr:hypothetical protein AAFF_G00088270 [Aldrovandia affinis]
MLKDGKVHTDHFGFDFCTGDIFCPVPSGCDTPDHVTIFSNAMSVGVAGWEPTFIPVLNQEPKSSGFDFSFTVCISTMFGNYSNTLQVVESMEMYRLLGVQRVVVYKNSCSPEVQKVLDYYVSRAGLAI